VSTASPHLRRRAAIEVDSTGVLVLVALVAFAGFAASARWAVLLSWVVPVVWAAAIDAHECRLPDRVVVVGSAAFALLLAVGSLVTGDSSPLAGAAAGALLLGGSFALVHLIFPAGFGFGDVKFGVLLGLGLGVLRPGIGFVVFVTAAVLQLGVMRWRPWPAQRASGADRGSAPFGPALAVSGIGWMAVLLVSGGGV
jgi:leader peptidase (prepilin peptidase)/N-methyltransferase